MWQRIIFKMYSILFNYSLDILKIIFKKRKWMVTSNCQCWCRLFDVRSWSTPGKQVKIEEISKKTSQKWINIWKLSKNSHYTTKSQKQFKEKKRNNSNRQEYGAFIVYDRYFVYTVCKIPPSTANPPLYNETKRNPRRFKILMILFCTDSLFTKTNYNSIRDVETKPCKSIP